MSKEPNDLDQPAMCASRADITDVATNDPIPVEGKPIEEQFYLVWPVAVAAHNAALAAEREKYYKLGYKEALDCNIDAVVAEATKPLVQALEWAADYLEGQDGDEYVAGKLRTALAKHREGK